MDDVRPIMIYVSDPAGPAAQPPVDALLWRVHGLHHEIVCYAVVPTLKSSSASQRTATTNSS